MCISIVGLTLQILFENEIISVNKHSFKLLTHDKLLGKGRKTFDTHSVYRKLKPILSVAHILFLSVTF